MNSASINAPRDEDAVKHSSVHFSRLVNSTTNRVFFVRRSVSIMYRSATNTSRSALLLSVTAHDHENVRHVHLLPAVWLLWREQWHTIDQWHLIGNRCGAPPRTLNKLGACPSLSNRRTTVLNRSLCSSATDVVVPSSPLASSSTLVCSVLPIVT